MTDAAPAGPRPLPELYGEAWEHFNRLASVLALIFLEDPRFRDTVCAITGHADLHTPRTFRPIELLTGLFVHQGTQLGGHRAR